MSKSKPAKKPKPPAKARRSVSEFRNGRAVRWCYVIPAERVAQLRRRISRNPNIQTNRALVFLGLPPAKGARR